jgi:hypothetical protein
MKGNSPFWLCTSYLYVKISLKRSQKTFTSPKITFGQFWTENLKKIVDPASRVKVNLIPLEP